MSWSEQQRDLRFAAGVIRRKPFQDSPTPAGNSAAAIALFRMHAYTNEKSYREKAEDTLEVFAGIAEQYGMFAATYALAAVWLLEGHTQVVVVGNDERAREFSERTGVKAYKWDVSDFEACWAPQRSPPDRPVVVVLPSGQINSLVRSADGGGAGSAVAAAGTVARIAAAAR